MPKPSTAAPAQSTQTSELAAALREAIEGARGVQKKTISTRRKMTPWSPKDGSPKLKLRRIMYHHGLKIEEDRTSNDEIEALNKLKPGSYCNGFVKVIRRKDRGLDIDYPIRTASHRLKLINEFGITSFVGLCNYLINEAAQPKKIANEDIDD